MEPGFCFQIYLWLVNKLGLSNESSATRTVIPDSVEILLSDLEAFVFLAKYFIYCNYYKRISSRRFRKLLKRKKRITKETHSAEWLMPKTPEGNASYGKGMFKLGISIQFFQLVCFFYNVEICMFYHAGLINRISMFFSINPET